ncbi:hypothetical protein [Nitratidesulfovibrio liaohensis]|uniref:hypothetical protein n=1 Tax=Nitratidesulfovibrio liaohensis TaxID=2604158 RepID=UPI0014248038|nr:hypothetical protein [Nitratidesulfovibrio liaohensis]NHZ47100.1 hypothetical protein [Nitratidesulfovibrio liaohensis]
MTTTSISVRFKRVLKILHIFFAGLWIGGTASLALLICLYHPQNPEEFHAKSSILMLLDYYIIAPGALGCSITGFIYGLKTKYGFFRFKWITIKWIINVSFILFGAIIVVPWLEYSITISTSMQNIAEESAKIIFTHILINIIQWAVILFMLFLSVFKPWSASDMHD